MEWKAKQQTSGCFGKTKGFVENQVSLNNKMHEDREGMEKKGSFNCTNTVKATKHVTIVDIQQDNRKENISSPELKVTIPFQDSELPSWLRLGRNYKGFCPFRYNLQHENPVPRIPFVSITPEKFFDLFVITRRPCVLTTNYKDFQTHTGLKEFFPVIEKWKKNDYLKKAAGDVSVHVEYSSGGDPVHKFGHGKRIMMSFREFLNHIQSEREDFYLTTQKTTPFDFGNPVLTLTSLSEDFPSIPSILKSLFPYEYNLWFGNTTQKTSTGLHHDFHDNLYFLLRGQKTFRLFSPSCAEILGVQRPIVHIHENGLITYEPYIRSDGFPALHVMKWKLLQAKHQIRGLQQRSQTVQEALKILRGCLRSLDLSSNRKTDEGRRILMTMGKLRRLSKRSSLNSFCSNGSTLPNSKLSHVVTQGFLKKLSKIRPKHAKALLQQEIKSRKESKDLLKFYIEEATERLLDLRLQYKALQVHLETPHLVSDDCNPNKTTDSCAELTTQFFRPSCSKVSDANSVSHIKKKSKSSIRSKSHLEKVEASFSKKNLGKLLIKRKKVLAKNTSQLNQQIGTSSFDVSLNENTKNRLVDETFEDKQQNKEEEDMDGDDDDDDENLDEDDFFTGPLLKTLSQKLEHEEEDDSENEENEIERKHPVHFCTHNTIDRHSSEEPVTWGRFPTINPQKIVAYRKQYPGLSDEAITMLQSYIEVDLNPGEFMYLPAGWFHEVFSFFAPPCQPKSKKKAKDAARLYNHMALNYWFYPPHVGFSEFNPDEPIGTFEKPYQDGFCSRRYHRLEMIRSQLPYIG